MTEKLVTNNFLHYEVNQQMSRETLKALKDVKKGDLLILTNEGYDVFTGDRLEVKSDIAAHEFAVAIALEDGKKGEKVACIVRLAMLVKNQINHIKTNSFEQGQALADVQKHFAAQFLILRDDVGGQYE